MSHPTRRQFLTAGAATGTALLTNSMLADDAADAGEPDPLYLHWMAPPLYNRGGDLEQPARRLVTTLVTISHDLDVVTGDHEVRIRGRIDVRGQNFHVDLQATYATGTMFFEGEVEPERIFDSYGGAFASAVLPTRCALSRSRDCQSFLDEQLEGYREYRPVRAGDE